MQEMQAFKRDLDVLMKNGEDGEERLVACRVACALLTVGVAVVLRALLPSTAG